MSADTSGNQASMPVSSGTPHKPLPLKEQVANLEKRIIASTLKSAKTIRQTARTLKISHPALLNKMKKYNIKKVTRVTM